VICRLKKDTPLFFLLLLQREQHATRLDSSCVPPFDSGTM